MNKEQLKKARHLLGLNQTGFAARLGWTTKRNIVSLERGDKEVTVQTALAVECLLRRSGRFGDFEMLNQLKKDVEDHKALVVQLIEDSEKFTISITDNVCALCFKQYAKSENWDVNNFEINFDDANNVGVSRNDFITYQFQFSDRALELEGKYVDFIDELRDAQDDAIDEIGA
jgi:DNA-binding XRE family transcriptional regulator